MLMDAEAALQSFRGWARLTDQLLCQVGCPYLHRHMQSGTVLAVPKGSAQRSSADFAVELKPPAGVGRLLTSLFARYSFLAHGPHLNQLAQHSRSLIGSHP